MMPMMDVFAPDINSVSARSVYPTAPGGSTASAAGALSQNTNVILTDTSTGQAGIATTAGAPSPSRAAGKGLWYWVGIVVLLLVMVFVARKAGGEEDFRNIRPTFYNFMAITLTAVVGIFGLKVIFARWRIAGLSDVLMAV